jgi:hypothetical protein
LSFNSGGITPSFGHSGTGKSVRPGVSACGACGAAASEINNAMSDIYFIVSEADFYHA